MGLFSRFESKAEDVIEGGAGRGRGGIEPVKLAKRAFKEMQREKMVGVGHEYAPTLYNVLLSPEDDAKMSGYYPSLAGEIETYLTGKAKSSDLVFDCPPLVRFIVDDGLRRGRFDIIAENVSPAIIADLREEEMEHYGIKKPREQRIQAEPDPFAPAAAPAPAPAAAPAPVPAPAAKAQPQPQPKRPVAPYDAPDDDFDDAPAAKPGVPYDAPDDDVDDAQAYRSPSPQQAERLYPPTEPPADQPASEPERGGAAKTVLLGTTPAPAPKAALYDFASQVRHTLSADRIIIGRGSSCDIIVNNPSVSRHHAELLHDESGWLIRDTGSTNGTNVNGARASQARIYGGDILTLGTAELEFQEA